MKTEIVQIIENKLAGYKGQLEMSEGCLVACNWIMVINAAYTVALDENGVTVKSTKAYPSQFSEKGAKQIETGCSFTNNRGEKIIPQRVFYKDWYRNQISELESVLETLK